MANNVRLLRAALASSAVAPWMHVQDLVDVVRTTLRVADEHHDERPAMAEKALVDLEPGDYVWTRQDGGWFELAVGVTVRRRQVQVIYAGRGAVDYDLGEYRHVFVAKRRDEAAEWNRQRTCGLRQTWGPLGELTTSFAEPDPGGWAA